MDGMVGTDGNDDDVVSLLSAAATELLTLALVSAGDGGNEPKIDS